MPAPNPLSAESAAFSFERSRDDAVFSGAVFAGPTDEQTYLDLQDTVRQLGRELDAQRRAAGSRESVFDLAVASDAVPDATLVELHYQNDTLWGHRFSRVLNDGVSMANAADGEDFDPTVPLTVHPSRATVPTDSTLRVALNPGRDVTFEVPSMTGADLSGAHRLAIATTGTGLTITVTPPMPGWFQSRTLSNVPESIARGSASLRSVDSRPERVETVSNVLSDHYSDKTVAQYLAFESNARDSFSLSAREPLQPLLTVLGDALDVPPVPMPSIGDLLFTRSTRCRTVARTLAHRGPETHQETIHTLTGRALGYPNDAIRFYCDELESRPPTTLFMLETAARMRSSGRLSDADARHLELVPYAAGRSEKAVSRAVDAGREYAAEIRRLDEELGVGVGGRTLARLDIEP